MKRPFLCGTLILALTGGVFGSESIRVVPYPRISASALTRQAWVDRVVELRRASFLGKTTDQFLANERRFYSELPSGTEVFFNPAIAVEHGGSVMVFDRATIVETAAGYKIYEKGRFAGLFPLSAKVTHVPVSYVEIIKPGQNVPPSYLARIPDTIAP